MAKIHEVSEIGISYFQGAKMLVSESVFDFILGFVEVQELFFPLAFLWQYDDSVFNEGWGEVVSCHVLPNIYFLESP